MPLLLDLLLFFNLLLARITDCSSLRSIWWYGIPSRTSFLLPSFSLPNSKRNNPQKAIQ